MDSVALLWSKMVSGIGLIERNVVKKIKWEYRGQNYARASVGCIAMQCNVHYISKRKMRWSASMSIQQRSNTFRHGAMRTTMAKAQQDAVELAHELLLDYHTCLLTEMKNFDMVE